MNKSRSRAYNRDVSKRKALRKKRLAEEVYYNGNYPMFIYTTNSTNVNYTLYGLTIILCILCIIVFTLKPRE